MFRLQGPSLIKERSSCPSDQDPLITQHSHLIGPLDSPTLPISLPTSQGLPSCFGGVCSHDPHRLPWYPFNPYLPDPLTLLLIIHLSHDGVFCLFSLSHDTLIVLLTLQS